MTTDTDNVSTDIPLYITELIDVLERELREHETQGGKLRDTINSIRTIYGVSTLGAVVVATPAPAPETARAAPVAERPAPRVAARESVTRPHGRNREDRLARVLAAATKMGRPFRAGEIRMQVSDIPMNSYNDYLAQLVASGQLTKTGSRAGTRYFAASTFADKPSKSPEAQSTVPGDDMKRLRQFVMDVLATGASYDMPGLLKCLRGVTPPVTEERLQPILVDLVAQQRVQKLPTDAGVRFRKRAA